MADSTLLLLNQMYGITSSTTNFYSDSQNKDVIQMQQGALQFEKQIGTSKNNVSLDDYQNVANEDNINIQTNVTMKFQGYLNADYNTDLLQKKAGNYWIVEADNTVIFYTGKQFRKLGGGQVTVAGEVVKDYNLSLINNEISYTNGVTYQQIRKDILNKTIVRLHYNGDIYKIGNIKENVLQFSFDDEDNYKQLRLFDNKNNYKIEIYCQTHNNYLSISD